MFFFLRISYKLSALLIVFFFVAGVILAFVALGLYTWFIYKRESKVRENQIEMIESLSRYSQNATGGDLSKVKIDAIDENESDDSDEAIRRQQLELVINKRKSSMVIKKSYPIIDLSKVESKYMNRFQSNDPRFKNYLKKSQRSFLGYDNKSGSSNTSKTSKNKPEICLLDC